MATTLCDQEPQETECSLCQDSFLEPKILPCGHLFCRDCIVSLITKRNQPECPLCRHTFLDPTETAANSAHIADRLPTDFALDELAESVDLLAKEPVCCVCNGIKAESICIQCREMLCSTCTTAHEKLHITSSHHVESLSTVTPERLAARRPALCADHGEKQSHFCSNHGLAVCAYCLVANHRLCPEVKDLDNEMKSAREALRSLTDVLTNAEENMEEAIIKLDVHLNESHSCIKSIETARESLLSIFAKQKEAVRTHSVERKSVRDARQTLRNKLAVIRSHIRILARTRKVCPRPGVIDARRALQQRLRTLDLKATLPADMSSISLERMADYYDLLRQIKAKVRELEEHKINREDQQLTFHTNRGNGVLLSDEGQLAAGETAGGVVVSCNALRPGSVYKIQVMEMARDWQPADIQFFGVTGTHPNDLNIKTSAKEMEDVLTVHQRSRAFGMDLKVNSIIRLVTDPVSNLYLSVDSGQLTAALTYVPRPCYAVFDLGINVKKVRVLRVNTTTFK